MTNVRCPRCDNIIDVDFSYDAEDNIYLCNSGAFPCGHSWGKDDYE